MPDKRHHRGQHPGDQRLFSPDHVATLRTAVAELSWLLSHGYAIPSSLKLVGDRYALTERQRSAIMRCACPDEAITHRGTRRVDPTDCAGHALGVDGYNLLITVESALSDGVLLLGRDGCLRDLASVHGTYRKVEETAPAITLIARHLAGLSPTRIDWYLDRPVSNSGRLKALMAEVLAEQALDRTPPWNMELVDSPDHVLRDYDGVVATCDAAVLDTCGAWTHLAGDIVSAHVPDAWIIDLSDSPSDFPIA